MNEKIKYVWKLIDTALFGKQHPKKALKEAYNDYCVIKSALLTEAFEMYKVLFSGEDWKDFYTNDIPEVIKKARSITENIIKRSEITSNIKQRVLREMIENGNNGNKNINEVVKEETTKMTLNMLLDSLLLSEAISNCEDWNEKSKSKEFDIIKGSYDLFKEELTDIILKNV